MIYKILSDENYKTSLKDIKEDLNKCELYIMFTGSNI